MKTSFWKSRPRPAPAAASSLIPAMIVIALATSFLAIAASFTSQSSRFASRQQGVADLVAATDAALEYAYAAWKAAVVRKALQAPINTDLAAINPGALASGYPAFAASGITFTQLAIDTVNQNGAHIDPNARGALDGSATQNVPNYPGWTGYTYFYKVEATAQSTHHGNPSPVHVVRYFQLTQVPLFQAAIFYENTLEIHPGAPMIVSGLIHTNKDLWAQGFQLLQFKSNVSYVGAYHETADRSARTGWGGGTGQVVFPGASQEVTWADGRTSSSSQTKATQLKQVSDIDPFGGTSTSNNGLHDIIEKPPAGDTSDLKIYNSASLRITIDSTKPPTSNNRVTVESNGSITLSSSDIANVKAAVDAGATIYDQREAVNVTVTSLDMAKLNAATGADPAAAAAFGTPELNSLRAGGFNGVVYVQDTATNSKKAIRLKNGRKMPGNTTIASDNGIYVQGDFNTGGNQPSDVPANVSNPDGSAQPYNSGYNSSKGPSSCAIMADAVTVLSNNWNDSNANAALSSRTATPTTINAAVLAGDVKTNLNNNGVASGGAHNFPRFLENWNNVNFSYWGSLVEAFYSEKFTGLWQTNNVYYWPNRKWNFDTRFLDSPPPGTPRGVQFARGRWERN